MAENTLTAGEIAAQLLVALIQREDSMVGRGASSEVAAKQVADAYAVIYEKVLAKHGYS